MVARDAWPRAGPGAATYLVASAPVVARLSREMVTVFERPELKEIFSQNGNILAGSSPEALETLLKTQLAAWRKAVRFAKLPTI